MSTAENTPLDSHEQPSTIGDMHFPSIANIEPQKKYIKALLGLMHTLDQKLLLSIKKEDGTFQDLAINDLLKDEKLIVELAVQRMKSKSEPIFLVKRKNGEDLQTLLEVTSTEVPLKDISSYILKLLEPEDFRKQPNHILTAIDDAFTNIVSTYVKDRVSDFDQIMDAINDSFGNLERNAESHNVAPIRELRSKFYGFAHTEASRNF